jgi:LacI family transcriptional regulator, galactose operon repressor
LPSHPTIRDVAQKAGVSITTVSFVLNNRSDVTISEAVRKRVLAAAKGMDYRPSAMAAGLAGRRTRNLGVVFHREDKIISNPFYSFVIDGIIQEAEGKDFNLLFAYIDTSVGARQGLPKMIGEKNADGILLIGHSEPPMVDAIRDRGIPVVAIDNYPALKGVETIHADNRQGAFSAVEHLIQWGHKHIAMLTISGGRPSIEERREGWRAALLKNGLPLRKEAVLECRSLSFGGGYERAGELFRKNRKITALFCANDEMAAGALRAAREAGRRVPEDLSVAGFDNITMSHYTDPPLTTVSAPKEYMGRLAVSRLLEMVDNPESRPRRHEVPVELIVRASTGRPGSGA